MDRGVRLYKWWYSFGLISARRCPIQNHYSCVTYALQIDQHDVTRPSIHRTRDKRLNRVRCSTLEI